MELKKQTLTLLDRKELEMTGVIEVISFSDAEVLLETKLGKMIILGEGLNVRQLDLDDEEFRLDGYIKEIKYDQEDKVGGFIKRIFK